MPRFAANLSMMFTEAPFLDRFALAAEAGFKAVEFLFPYDHPATEVAARLRGAGLQQVLFNMPPGDWNAGERGLACLPDRQDEFREGVQRALDYAAALGCPRLHAMAGIPAAGLPYATAMATYTANLAWAAETCAAAGVRLLIEPINPVDVPGYFLNSFDLAADIIRALPQVGLQFDIYHCAMMAGRIVDRARALLPAIGHMQLADVPGRNEPGTGEINWPFVFARIDEMGYRGWIGCEYRPRAGTEAGLGWFASHRER
jgi:hydroxypyruvate isomerase